jgi:hypothetical protein
LCSFLIVRGGRFGNKNKRGKGGGIKKKKNNLKKKKKKKKKERRGGSGTRASERRGDGEI